MKDTIKFISIIAGFLLVVLAGALLLPEMEYYRSIFHYVAGSLIGLYLFIILQVFLFFLFKKHNLIKKVLWIFSLIVIGVGFFFLEKDSGDLQEAWVALYIFAIIFPLIIIFLPRSIFESDENNEDEGIKKLKDMTDELVEKRRQETN